MKTEHATKPYLERNPLDDTIVCVCGSEEQWPCDPYGYQVEPLIGEWGGLYVCDCGRIIDQDSLEIVGWHVV